MIVASGKVMYLWKLETMSMIQKYGRTNGSIHRENILCCKFNTAGTRLVSCGEDKRVVVWNVKEVLRTLAFFPDRPDKIVAGRSDGSITIWDLTVRGVIDNILPDPDWLHDGEEQSLVGWYGIEKHHSGAILAIAISPNGRFLASASTDHTTKLWSVVSYMKDIDIVQAELLNASQKSRQLDEYIQVHDDKYDVQIKMREFVGLRIGEVPLPTGYHSDLLFTFRHDAPVMSVAFSSASDRDSDEFYLVCQNRVLTFGYQASQKEEDLQETGRVHAGFFSGDNSRAKNTAQTGIFIDDDEEGEEMEVLAERKAAMTVSELKQLITHGLVLPSFLDTLLAQFKGIEAETLFYNMKKYKLHPQQLLRLLVNSKFHPRDILMALATKTHGAKLYSNALSGNPIHPIMIQLGFKPYDDSLKTDSEIYLHYRDFNPELYADQIPLVTGRNNQLLDSPHSPRRAGTRGGGETDEYRRQSLRDQQFYSNQSTEKYAGEMQGPKWQRHTPTGELVHFIPSMQLKLLKGVCFLI
ncbi:Target of rapamycin complex subunit lst8 [Podochytrium sp. JEL0797]|nr:Target of rapamycin complex subunit lst8 [Podochytrium sp. JEL0797]